MGPDVSHQVATLARRRILFVLPVLAFVAVAAVLAIGLGRDPAQVPSALIGKRVPAFALAPVPGRALGLASADLEGRVSLVNVFASWCVACRVEHPLLMRLAEEGRVPVHGLAYKDAPADAARWLDEMGDPYARTGLDRDGRVGIDWGVYGVPETFVVDKGGVIRFKHIGPLTPEAWQETVLPLVLELSR